MAQNKLPWKLRYSDFNQPNWHIRPTIAYELMFEFLRLSPSYELARKANAGELTVSDKASFPKDFDRVLETYALLGDVQKILFRHWWLARGLKVFGNPYAKAKVHKVADIVGGQDVEAASLVDEIDNYLSGIRQEEGLERTILIAIPVGLRKAEFRKQLDHIMDEIGKADATSAFKPIIELQGKRLRAKVLFNGIRLLWFRAAKPKWQEWRLGAKARISETYSKVLNPDNPRRTYGTLESYDREMMTKITHRALKKYEAIAENAARGRFPCDHPASTVTFDYPALAKHIQSKNAWEKAYKAKQLAVYKARLNKI